MHHQFTRSVRRVRAGAGTFTCASLLAATFASGAQARQATPKKKKKKTTTTTTTTSTMTVTPSTPITRGSRYLALGDSVSFGYQEPTVVPTPDYTNAANFVGFPEVIASDLHLKLANLACPGETSSSLIRSSAQSFGCESSLSPTPAYRPTFPLHTKYSGSQLRAAVKYLKANPTPVW